MELEIRYDLSDWDAFQKFLCKRFYKESKGWWDSAWLQIPIWAFIAYMFLQFFDGSLDFSWPTAAVAAFVLLYVSLIAVLNRIKVSRKMQPSKDGMFLRQHKFIINDDGISTIGSDYEAMYEWSVVQRVDKTDKAIYVFIDTVQALIFPLSKVEDSEELLAVINANVKSG